jgi:hypothetical protein
MPIHPSAQKLTIHKDEVTLKNGSRTMRLLVSGAECVVLIIAFWKYVKLFNLTFQPLK